MKVHINLATSDLERSTAFFSALLAHDPLRRLRDYALFVTEDPGLELALDVRATKGLTAGAHFGICVDGSGAVDAADARLREAGFATSVEREETCCYANQTKVWASDPDGRRWEVYTVHEETETRDGAGTTCCHDRPVERSCCPS